MDVIKATVREVQNICLHRSPTSTVPAVCVRCCLCRQWLLLGWDANPQFPFAFSLSITGRINSFDSFGPVECTRMSENNRS